MNKGDLAAAEPLHREAMKRMRETLGDRHPTTLSCIRNLGALGCCREQAKGKADLGLH